MIEAAFLKSLHSATRISNSLRRGCKGTSFLNKKRSFGGGPRSFLVTFRFAQIMLCSAISDEFTVNLKGHLILFTATPDPGIFLYWNVEKNDLDFTHAPPNASLITYQGLQMTVWQVLRLQRVTYVRRSHTSLWVSGRVL